MSPTRRSRAYEQYKDQPPVGPDDLDELTRRYAYLVHVWARRYSGTSSGVVDWEDLVSVGMMGLIQAHRRFDPSAGKPFAVYAEFRIKGAILDELRRVDPFSQPQRRKARKLAQTLQQLQQELGRAPDEAELAKHLNMTLPQVRELLAETNAVRFDSVDSIDRQDLSTHIAVSGWNRSDLQIALTRAIRELDQRSQTIISLYYMEGLSMAEVADVLDLTEARISQLHSAAIKRLREAVGGGGAGESRAEDVKSPKGGDVKSSKRGDAKPPA